MQNEAAPENRIEYTLTEDEIRQSQNSFLGSLSAALLEIGGHLCLLPFIRLSDFYQELCHSIIKNAFQAAIDESGFNQDEQQTVSFQVKHANATKCSVKVSKDSPQVEIVTTEDIVVEVTDTDRGDGTSTSQLIPNMGSATVFMKSFQIEPQHKKILEQRKRELEEESSGSGLPIPQLSLTKKTILLNAFENALKRNTLFYIEKIQTKNENLYNVLKQRTLPNSLTTRLIQFQKPKISPPKPITPEPKPKTRRPSLLKSLGRGLVSLFVGIASFFGRVARRIARIASRFLSFFKPRNKRSTTARLREDFPFQKSSANANRLKMNANKNAPLFKKPVAKGSDQQSGVEMDSSKRVGRKK